MVDTYKDFNKKKISVNARVKAMMDWLNEKPNNDGIAVRQSKTILTSVFMEFMNYCDELFNARGVLREVGEWKRHFTHAQRFMSDHKGDYEEVDNAFFRFECTDFYTGIEYPQPFYAKHPSEFDGRIL